MVNLAAESSECRSGNATHHKASLNSDLAQQRTFSSTLARHRKSVWFHLHFLRARGRIGLLRVEGESCTCSFWVAIKMQMTPWPYTSGIIKVRICLMLNNRKADISNMIIDFSEVPVQPKTRRNRFFFKNGLFFLFLLLLVCNFLNVHVWMIQHQNVERKEVWLHLYWFTF